MNGDVVYDLTGGHVSFDTLWRLDQLAATLTGHLGWQVRVEIDPGVTLTASPARDCDDPGTPWEALLSPEGDPYGRTADRNDSNPLDGRTALEGT